MVERQLVAMILRRATAVFTKKTLFFPGCSVVILLARPNLSPAISGAPRLVVGPPKLVTGSPRCSQLHLVATALVQSTLGFDHAGMVLAEVRGYPASVSVGTRTATLVRVR